MTRRKEPSQYKRQGRYWECGSTHHSQCRCSEIICFKFGSRGHMYSDCHSIHRSDDREEETPWRHHRGLAGRTNWYEANGHAARVTKEGPRSEDGESLETGPLPYQDQDNEMRSDCSSDGELLPKNRPKRPCSKIEVSWAPPQNRIGSEKRTLRICIDSVVPHTSRTQTLRLAVGQPKSSTYDIRWKSKINLHDLQKFTEATETI